MMVSLSLLAVYYRVPNILKPIHLIAVSPSLY